MNTNNIMQVLFSKVVNQVGSFDNPWLIFSKYIDAVNENYVKDMLQNGKQAWWNAAIHVNPLLYHV
jgi:hypothetical protein